MEASDLKEVDAIWLAPKRAAADAAAGGGRRGPLGEARRLSSDEAPRRLSSSVARGRRSATLDAMLAEEDAAQAKAAELEEAVETDVEAERGAVAAARPGPPAAVFGKRKRAGEVGGEEVQRRESKGAAAEGAASKGAAGGEARPAKQPKLRNTALVNRRVRVWWGGDRQWFAGIVTSYSSRRGHQVQYTPNPHL